MPRCKAIGLQSLGHSASPIAFTQGFVSTTRSPASDQSYSQTRTSQANGQQSGMNLRRICVLRHGPGRPLEFFLMTADQVRACARWHPCSGVPSLAWSRRPSGHPWLTRQARPFAHGGKQSQRARVILAASTRSHTVRVVTGWSPRVYPKTDGSGSRYGRAPVQLTVKSRPSSTISEGNLRTRPTPHQLRE
jgi:hypothetical protein